MNRWQVRALKHFPFPEVTHNVERRGAWVIEELRHRGGNTSNVERRMAVPLSGDVVSAAIRTHEMAHKEWSPKRVGVPGVPDDILQIAEDARIHAKLAWVARNTTIDGFARDQALMNPAAYLDHEGKINWRQLALVVADHAALQDTSVALNEVLDTLKFKFPDDATQRRHVEFAQQVRGRVIELLQAAYRKARHNADVLPFTATKAVGRELDRMLRAYDDELATPPPPPELGIDRVADAAEAAAGRGPVDRGRGGKVPADGEWAPMVVVYPPLSVSGATAAARKRRAKDYGVAMMHPHRLHVDGKVFGEMKKVKGGTVLVDVSGSMHFTPEEIEALIVAAPAIVVATYSGSGKAPHAHCGGTPHGALSVVGKGGRRTQGRNKDGRSYVKPCGGQNIVDGPALKWLAKQKEPRYWVSDGSVTGVARVGREWIVDGTFANLLREAVRVCVAGRIKRVDSIEALLEAIRTQGRKGVAHGLPALE